MKKSLLILFFASLFFAGCYYDNEEELYPSVSTCDTSNVTYSNQVKNILQSGGCLGCHSSGTASGGVILDTHTEAAKQATNGKLYGSIAHSSGFSPMPKGGSKLDNCKISQIKKWVDAGAPNN